MRFYRPNTKALQFDLTPIINVVIQLLIFFIQTTTIFNVTITENNVIYINYRLIDPNSLSEKVQEEIKSNHNSLVVLEADQNISHGKVVRVMDLIKKGGAERIAIATKPREK